MRILALDPAQNNTGVVVMWGAKIMETSTIRLKTDLDGVKKWMYLQDAVAKEINALIHEWNIEVIVSEFPHGSQSASALRGLAQVSGVISGVAQAHNLPLHFFTEYDVKRTLFGHAKGVSKEEMMYRVFGIFEPFSYIPPVKPNANKLQHECDALGVLATYLKQVKVIS